MTAEILHGVADIVTAATDNKVLNRVSVEAYETETETYRMLGETAFEQGKATYALDTTAYAQQVTGTRRN